MNDKFTLLTAFYNGSQYLNDWVQSISNQCYRPLEVVFVNDCSLSLMMHIRIVM